MKKIIVVLRYTPVNPESPTRVTVSVFSSNNVRITPKRNWGWMRSMNFYNTRTKDSADIFQTDRIFRECCMMCRTEKSKQSYVTSWIVSAEKQPT